jgi:CRP-like cAMP-binding protein
METTQFLKKTAIFARCSDKELKTVIDTAKERSFTAGTKIIREGHPGGRGFYLILAGTAEVRKGEKLLATFRPGDYFGEMALLLEDTPRTADVVAVTDVTCLVITSWDFKALLATHPEIGATIMTELARRLRDTDSALSE